MGLIDQEGREFRCVSFARAVLDIRWSMVLWMAFYKWLIFIGMSVDTKPGKLSFVHIWNLMPCSCSRLTLLANGLFWGCTLWLFLFDTSRVLWFCHILCCVFDTGIDLWKGGFSRLFTLLQSEFNCDYVSRCQVISNNVPSFPSLVQAWWCLILLLVLLFLRPLELSELLHLVFSLVPWISLIIKV